MQCLSSNYVTVYSNSRGILTNVLSKNAGSRKQMADVMYTLVQKSQQIVRSFSWINFVDTGVVGEV
jgi:hypothetical protein